ncbi:MAG: aldose 1-epimerase [Clostridia bacterium]|nr:aldose 1-epimerase [Clostridia bacterium]
MIETNVKISACGYSAYFRSDLGGNCYRLCHEPTGSELLRTPKNEEELFSEIHLFGNPILFPPNRIRGGEFTFEERKYVFPINEPATGCHLHGELYRLPFEVASLESDRVVFEYSAKSGEYLGFPHAFRVKREYVASENGLCECTEVTNESDENMPFMIAFHTTLNIPFSPYGDADSCKLTLPALEEQLRDKNYLPVLKYASGREREKALNSGSYAISASPISSLYEVSGARACITDEKAKLSLVYDCDDSYRYRMLWRRDGAPFIALEPQTCAIDCFHLEKPAHEKGLIVIEPHKSVKLRQRLCLNPF